MAVYGGCFFNIQNKAKYPRPSLLEKPEHCDVALFNLIYHFRELAFLLMQKLKKKLCIFIAHENAEHVV